MRRTFIALIFGLVTGVAVIAASQQTQLRDGSVVFLNGRIVVSDGAGSIGPSNAAFVVRAGKIELVWPASRLPANKAPVVDLGGGYVVPGFIAAHAHVSDVNGLKPRAYTDENTRRQLGVYARYGITSVFSLGGEQAPAFALRDAQSGPALDRARIFVSGDVITGATPEAARQAVARVAALKPDIIKIRVDDNLGSATKMTPEVYRAVIEEAHARKLRVAAHIFYLEDAKALLKAGVDMIAHSIRDKDIDDETIALFKARNVPYCPTLTREISTFVYESTPDFFKDPFFLKEADRDLMSQLQDPTRQKAMASSKTAQAYKAALEVAKRNLKKASDAGVLIAMGTDSGPAPERFQGYFEHLEMAMMAEAGMSPAAVLRASTSSAARATGRQDLGAIAAGQWADFVVLERNPLTDISATKSIKSVWISGAEIKR